MGQPLFVYVDTEFTNFINPSLISAGLVSDAGELYFEVMDFDRRGMSQFVADNVLTVLSNQNVITTSQIANMLERWIDGLPTEITEVAWVVDYILDWSLIAPHLPAPGPNGTRTTRSGRSVSINLLFIQSVVADMSSDDVQSMWNNLEQAKTAASTPNTPECIHNALFDAKAFKCIAEPILAAHFNYLLWQTLIAPIQGIK